MSTIIEKKEEMDEAEKKQQPPVDPIERENFKPFKEKKAYQPKIRELNCDRKHNRQ